MDGYNLVTIKYNNMRESYSAVYKGSIFQCMAKALERFNLRNDMRLVVIDWIDIKFLKADVM